MAALDPIDIRFGGLETKIDPRLVQPGASLVLENVEHRILGALSKRNGYTALTRNLFGAGTIAAGKSLATHKGELLLGDGEKLYTWAPSGGEWKEKADLVNVGVKTERIPSGAPGVPVAQHIDVAVANDIAVYTWEDAAGDVVGTVIDLATGATILAGVTISSGSAPRAVAVGDDIFVLVIEGANIVSYVLDTTAPEAFGAGVTLASDAGGGFAFDVRPLSGTFGVLVYENTTPTITLQLFTSFGVAGASATVAEDPASELGVVVSANLGIYVAYRQAGTNALRCFARNIGLVEVFAPVTIETDATIDRPVGIEQATNSILWCYDATADTSSQTSFHIRKATISSAGTVTDVDVLARSVSVASRPFIQGNKIYLVAHFSGQVNELAFFGNGQAGYYLVDSAGVVAARTLHGQGLQLEAQLAGLAIYPSSVAQVASGEWLIPAVAVFPGSVILGINYPSPAAVRFDFNHSPAVVTFGENMLIASGCLWEYDGGGVFENNFHFAPEISTTAGTGGSLALGTYRVRAVWAYWDSRGQLHRSAPSVESVITLTGSQDEIVVTIPHMRLTRRELVILVYVSDLDGDALFEQALLANDYETDLQTHSITTVAGITDNAQLYTDDGTLEHGAPPHLQSLAVKGERLYGVTPEGIVLYTHDRIEGEGVAFVPDVFARKLLQDGGDEWRLVESDGVIYAFGEKSIQGLVGEGFDAQGTVDTLSRPTSVATTVSPLPGTPLLGTDQGVWFKSATGICLLTRAREVDSTIGYPVESFKDLSLVSVVAVPGRKQVRFGHSDGSALVYDFGAGKWSVFTNHTQVAAALWDSLYCLLRSDGTVWVQSTGFTDGDAAAITRAVETPWLRVKSLSDHIRLGHLYLLGEYRSEHTLTLKAYYDYGPDVVTTWTEPVLEADYDSGDELHLRHHLGRQCSAARFRLEESGAGEAAVWSGLSLEIAPQRGGSRLPQSRTF